jgi:hypothetical protein
MAYAKLCGTTDLNAYYQGITLSTSTKPTLAQVNDWIDQSTALIYSAVAENYAIPVTDTDDLLILKNLSVKYVRDELNFVLGKNRVNIAANQMMTPRTISHKGFEKKLDKLREGTFRLLNTSPSTEVEVYSYTAANSITAESKKGTAQW